MNKLLTNIQTNLYWFICILFFIAYPVKSEEITDLFELSLNELFEVQIASKTNETVISAPSSVTVVTRQQIQQMGISRLEELLAIVPGFVVTRDSDGTLSRFSVRGRSTQASESVLVLLNGQRQNTLFTGSITRVNPYIPLENVERVEIIRGPGSAIYGSNAFLGVVNIITSDQLNNISITLGDYNLNELVINASSQIENWRWSIFGKSTSYDGYKFSNVTDKFGQVMNIRDPMSGLDLNVSLSNDIFSIFYRHVERENSDFFVFGALDEDINQQKSKQDSIQLELNVELTKNSTLTLSGGYLQDEIDELFLVRPQAGSMPFALAAGPTLESYRSDLSAEIEYQLSDSQLITAGFIFEESGFNKIEALFNFHPITLQFLDGITRLTDINILYIPDIGRNIYGTYLQDKINLTEELTIFAGIRWDKYSDFGESINPRLAIIYGIDSKSSIKLMYGSAFRAPTFNELFNQNAPTRVGNSNLNAENIETIEIAYYMRGEKWHSDITYFHNTIEDLIMLGTNRPVIPQNPFGAVQYEQRSDDNQTSGFELDFGKEITEYLNFSANMTYMISNNPEFPDFSGSIALNYQNGNHSTYLDASFQDQVEVLPNESSYWLLGLTSSYRWENLKLQLRINNLLNEDYQSYSSSLSLGIPNSGRTLQCSAIYRF